MRGPVAGLAGLMLLLAAVAGTGAEEPDDFAVPPGHAEIGVAGGIHVFAPTAKPPGWDVRTDLLARLKKLYDLYHTKFGLDQKREVLRVGLVDAGGLLRTARGKPDRVALVLLPDAEAYEAWVARGGGVGRGHHIGEYVNLVSLALDDRGGVGPGGWTRLWHEFAHVFYWQCVASGEPVWLSEGLALHFTLTCGPVKLEDNEDFWALIRGLRERKSSGMATPIGEVLRSAPGAELDAQHAAEAWVLAHYLITEEVDLLNAIIAQVQLLEAAFADDQAALRRDVGRYVALLLIDAFGGESKLQAAWDAHLAAILADPKDPKKQPRRPTSPRVPVPGCSIEAQVGAARPVEVERKKDDPPERRPKEDPTMARRLSGTVVFRAPWDAEVTVRAALGDGHDHWLKETVVAGPRKLHSGEAITFKDVNLPTQDDSVAARVTVTWKVESGAEYRTVRSWAFR